MNKFYHNNTKKEPIHLATNHKHRRTKSSHDGFRHSESSERKTQGDLAHERWISVRDGDWAVCVCCLIRCCFCQERVETFAEFTRLPFEIKRVFLDCQSFGHHQARVVSSYFSFHIPTLLNWILQAVASLQAILDPLLAVWMSKIQPLRLLRCGRRPTQGSKPIEPKSMEINLRRANQFHLGDQGNAVLLRILSSPPTSESVFDGVLVVS